MNNKTLAQLVLLLSDQIQMLDESQQRLVKSVEHQTACLQDLLEIIAEQRQDEQAADWWKHGQEPPV